NLRNGNRTIISSPTVGTGPVISDPEEIAINSTGTTAYVLQVDSNLSTTFFKVDLETGNRSIVSGNGVGAGPDFAICRSLAINATETFAYIGDNGNGMLYRVN